MMKPKSPALTDMSAPAGGWASACAGPAGEVAAYGCSADVPSAVPEFSSACASGDHLARRAGAGGRPTPSRSFLDQGDSGFLEGEGDLESDHSCESDVKPVATRQSSLEQGSFGFLGRVLVLGLGKSGKSAARYCAGLLGSRVQELFIAAGARTDDSVAFVESLVGQFDSCIASPGASTCHPERNGANAPKDSPRSGIGYAFGDDALDGDVGHFDLCIASPGASTCHPERSEGSPRSGIGYAFGDDALDGDVGHFDLCIASPGIPYWHELYVRGEQVSDELVSEVEFAWRESDPDSTWVAITGTNGKTTTTSLAAHVLRACGFAADAVGNIGDVCLDAVAAGRTRVYVAELSSYQLYSTRSFAPDIAVMLNITPDHIHWHKTLEAYRDAKFKMIDNMQASAGTRPSAAAEPSGAQPGGRRDWNVSHDRDASGEQDGRVVILDATNDVVRAKVRQLKAMTREERGFDYVPMGTADGIHGDMRAKCGAENAAFLDGDDVLRVALGGVEHALLPACDLQIKGEHNASNALAAAAVAVALGADDAAIAAGLASFEPLVHRIEPCGSVAGAACYNDSKATNVDATLKALQAFPGKRVVILLGGDDKGTDLTELVAAVYEHAAVAVCYGEGGPRFAEALEGGCDTKSDVLSHCENAPALRAGNQNQCDSTSDLVSHRGSAPALRAGNQNQCDSTSDLVSHRGNAPALRAGSQNQCDSTSDLVSHCQVIRANHMEDALDAALDAARPGDVVLLSPACASFDEFRSFEHRGDVFKQLVAERAAVRGA